MKLAQLPVKECPVYPGEYSPMPLLERLMKKTMLQDHPSIPLANMDEHAHCFMVEVVIPGAIKEGILVTIDNNILSVAALQYPFGRDGRQLKLHEIEPGNFKRNLMLPPNIDVLFANAQYKEGILCVWIPKSNTQVTNLRASVIVY